MTGRVLAPTLPEFAVRRLAIALLLLVLLVVGGGVALLASINPDAYRADLQEAARRATGRTLTIGGPLHLALGLTPALEATDLRLANLPGGSRPAMLHVDRARAEVALLPLLAGDLVIETLRLNGVDLLLERVQDGTPNWSFQPDRRPLYAAGGGAGGHHGAGIEVQNLRIEGGTLLWHPRDGADRRLALDTLQASAPATWSATTIVASARAGDVPLHLDLTTGSLRRLLVPAPSIAGGWPISATLQAADARLRLDGGFTHPEALRGYDLRIAGTAPDLAALSPLAGGATLPALHELSLNAQLQDNDTGTPRLARLALSAGASDLSATWPGLAIQKLLLSATGPGQPVTLAADGTLDGQALHVAGSGTLPGMNALAPIPASLTIDAAGIAASAEGTIPPRAGAGGLALHAKARLRQLDALVPLLGPLPPIRDFVLDADLADGPSIGQSVALRHLAVTSSAGDASGNATLVWAPRRSLTARLASNALSIDGLLAASDTASPASSLPAPPAAPPVSAGAGPATAPAGGRPSRDWLRDTDAAVDLALKTAAWHGTVWRDVGLHLVLAGGRLLIDPLRATSAQGVTVGTLSLDGGQSPPALRLSLRAPAIPAELVSLGLGLPGLLSGTAQTDAQIAGSGRTPGEVFATATGHLGLAMAEGSLGAQALAGPVAKALAPYGITADEPGALDFSCLALRLDLAHGSGVVRRFALDSSRLTLSADGGVDFAGRMLNLRVMPRLQLGVTQAASALRLTGPFDAPRVALAPMKGSRFGIALGRLPPPPGGTCQDALAVARAGLPAPVDNEAAPLPPVPPPSGTVPPAVPPAQQGPTDLLQGILH